MIKKYLRDRLYLVYDANIETEDSLHRLTDKVIKAAGFDLDLIKTVPLEVVTEMLENDILPTYLICINQTFKDLNAIYSDKLEVPVYEFFSKEYINDSIGICMSGLLLNVDSIFEEAYKRYAWNIIKKFKTTFDEQYSKFQEDTKKEKLITTEVVEDLTENTELPSYLNMVEIEETPEVTEVKEEVVVKKEIQPTTIPSQKTQMLDDQTETLLNNIKLFFNLFDTIKKDLKVFERKVNE